MIKKITTLSFKKYGRVIEYPAQNQKGKVRNLWKIIHTESSKVGWRIAYLILRDKSLGRLECHPNSDETFEPVKGKALFFVSKTKTLKGVECFLLDKPVVVKKGIWHGLISLTPQTEIKVVENSKVVCRYWPWKFRVKTYQEFSKRQKEDNDGKN